jgi:imidazolonepropionase
MRIRLENIHTIYGIQEGPSLLKKGKDLSYVKTLKNAFIDIEDDLILDFGEMKDIKGHADKIIDCTGKSVIPGWCDSHTHIIFAASRHEEYRMRIGGKSYEEIAEAGGGILNSAKKLREMDEGLLYDQAAERVEELIKSGTVLLEIKSGYGLSPKSEIAMLRIARKLNETYPIEIKSTFLGAHAVPAWYKNNRQAYIDEICNVMLPEIAKENLADYCDVFCDKGFYTVEESRQILQKAISFGLRPKIHANELAISGGVQLACEMNALSCDHLESMGQEEIDVLLDHDTIPVVLPGTSFYLNINYAPARKMIDQGLGITIASDYNPGSTPSGNMELLMSLACIKMKLSPEEAFNGITINGACALESEDKYGSIAKGKKGHLIITTPIDDLAQLSYFYGKTHVDSVLIGDKIYK